MVCEAFDLARKTSANDFGEGDLVKSLRSCEIRNIDIVNEFRAGRVPVWVFYGVSDSQANDEK